MIPRLATRTATPSAYAVFCAELGVRGFAGEVSEAVADRTVLSADNSSYQLTPQAIAFPVGLQDIDYLAFAANGDLYVTDQGQMLSSHSDGDAA